MLVCPVFVCLFLYLAHVNTGTVFACIIVIKIIIIKRMCVHIVTSVKKSNRIKLNHCNLCN